MTTTPVEQNASNAPPASPPNRRGFVAMLTGVALAGVAGLVPIVSALAAFLHPLRQKGAAHEPLRLASLEMLPPDGTPRRFPVVAERVNAWTTSVEPVGAVYLRRTGPAEVTAFQAVCPHAGCTIEHQPSQDAAGESETGFVCPCHKAGFDLSGRRLPGQNPSPRDMDQLDVEIRDGDQVWVHFQTFLLGTSDKVPTA
jgi:menaquinol-cytochrome c reductase iron-sulfur subunit